MPKHRRHVELLSPKFVKLGKALESRRASLQNSPMGTAIESVVVFETVGTVERFMTAVRHTPGMAWLAEWAEEEIPPDEDFYEPDEVESKLSGRLYLVMANQEAIHELLSLWSKYKKNRTAKFATGLTGWKDLFGQLHDVRRWGVKDRLDETGVRESWSELLEHHVNPIRLEAELWCRQTAEEQQRTFETFKRIVEEVGGRCLSQTCIPEISYHGVLAEAPAQTIASILNSEETKLVRAEQVMLFRPVGQSASPLPRVIETITFPERPRPFPHKDPIVALLDGAPLENHDLLRGRVLLDDPDGWIGSYQANHRHHGTGMASLIIHGELNSMEPPLNSHIYVRPVMRPNPSDWRDPPEEFVPTTILPIDLIYRAVRRIIEGDGSEPPAARTVRVINLSLGDPTQPFNRFISPWGRLLDWLSVKYNLLFVTSAGNTDGQIKFNHTRTNFASLSQQQIQLDALKGIQQTERFRALLAPADSINCLTVASSHMDSSGARPVGEAFNMYVDQNLISPYSRIGPGFRRSIKPDIVVPGGRMFHRLDPIQSGPPVVANAVNGTRAPGHLVACPSVRSGDTSACYHTRGTSNSAALTSRAAARIYEALLELEEDGNSEIANSPCLAVLLKAMVVHGASWADVRGVWEGVCNGWDQKKIINYISRYIGYGSPNFDRVLSCTDQRATIIGFGNLGDGEADLFRVPLPPSLSAQKQWRRLVITLAWNSPINPRNQKYRKAHLWFRPQKDALAVERTDAWWQAVERGTVQHVVLEGDAAAVYADGAGLEVKVNCRADAGVLEERVNYGLAVTLEVADSVKIPLYDEIRTRLSAAVRINPST